MFTVEFKKLFQPILLLVALLVTIVFFNQELTFIHKFWPNGGLIPIYDHASDWQNRFGQTLEDEEIAEISNKYGAEVPFLRPKELAQDDTPGIEPLLHCINWLKDNENYYPDYVCTLQCTSPFRKSNHIDEALEKLIEEKADSIIGVCKSEISPYWMKNIENGRLVDFIRNSNTYSRRQDLPVVYRLNGAMYIGKTNVLIKKRNWYTDNTLPYVMRQEDSIDIDTILDFKLAEIIMKEKLANE